MLRFGYEEEEQLLRPLGASAAVGEAGFTSLERLWLRPTLEVVGMGGGFQGEGIKTIVPRRAFVKLAARLVPDQTPKQVRRGGWEGGWAGRQPEHSPQWPVLLCNRYTHTHTHSWAYSCRADQLRAFPRADCGSDRGARGGAPAARLQLHGSRAGLLCGALLHAQGHAAQPRSRAGGWAHAGWVAAQGTRRPLTA